MHAASERINAGIHIQLAHLDSLMNLAGELVLSRNQLLQAVSSDDRRLLESTTQRIDLVASEIQEQIMRTRMQPVGMLFDRLARMAEDFAGEADKQIRVAITGKTVELDKTIMNALEAPLAQILEKAVRQGIEASATRCGLNKPEAGTLELRACHEAGQVIIDVVDDGSGIDPDDLVQSALENGLITEQEAHSAHSEAEKMAFVFLPGLFAGEDETTAGRQYAGMDETRACLEKLGGSINVSAQPDQGTCTRIKLPLTLSIIPSQMVCLGDERFAIPQANLSELLRVPAGEVKHTVETVGDASVIRLRGELLPVIDLAGVFGVARAFTHPADGRQYPERRRKIADRRSKDHDAREIAYDGDDRRDADDRRYHAQSALNIAVVSTGTFKYGLVVDAMNDSEEIVVKPLGKHLKGCRGFAGATIMGDGKVALILDVASIGELAALRSADAKRSLQPAASGETIQADGNAGIHSYLFFSNSEDERFAVPLETVARIEKVDASKIEVIGGSRVLKYRDRSLPLLALEDVIMVAPLPERSHYQVVCFNVNGREIGLLAAPPIDAAEVTITLDTKTLKQPGVTGSAVLDDKTTLILDIRQIVEIAKPDFFAEG